jgi:hypothetical protein
VEAPLPVHSGQYAAAFTVRSDVDGGSQVRCVQQGVFPTAAYYRAWYYIPNPVQIQNGKVWNLFHFQGAGDPGLWDVTLIPSGDGGIRTTTYDFLTAIPPLPAGVPPAPPVPIGRWFHIEVYFKRSAGPSGQILMWQDGMLAAEITGVQTDPTTWGQWYVGNLADFGALTPAESTVYVDDVMISAAP